MDCWNNGYANVMKKLKLILRLLNHNISSHYPDSYLIIRYKSHVYSGKKSLLQNYDLIINDIETLLLINDILIFQIKKFEESSSYLIELMISSDGNINFVYSRDDTTTKIIHEIEKELTFLHNIDFC